MCLSLARRCPLLAVVCNCAIGLAYGGSLTGHVRDGVTPASGVPGAKVQLRDSKGKLTDPVITDTDGQYDLKKVDDGEYTLVVTKVGYVPRPCEKPKVKVQETATADDVLLIQSTGNAAYYTAVATVIRTFAMAAPEQQRDGVLRQAWSALRTVNLPPASKSYVAVALNEQNAGIKDIVPAIRGYLKTTPDVIKRAQAMLEKALGDASQLPSESSLRDLGLDSDVVADLVHYVANDTAQTVDRRTLFVNEFRIKWDKTTTLKYFDGFSAEPRADLMNTAFREQTPSTPNNGAEAVAVIDKAVKALGGVEKLDAAGVVTWKTKGKVTLEENENKFSTKITAQGLDHFRQEFEGEFAGNSIKGVTVLDGDKGWRKFGDDATKLEDDGLANERRMVYLQLVPQEPSLMKRKDFRIESTEDERVDGKPATMIKATGPDGKEFQVYFDKSSGLPVKLTASVTDLQGHEFKQEETYSNYRDFDGIKRATRVENKRNGKKFLDYEITDYKRVEKVDSKAFAEP